MIEWIINLSIEERWFYGSTATVISGLLIALINQRLNHALAIRRENRRALIEASAKFRSVISIERIENLREYHLLAVLDSGLVPGNGEKFEGEYLKHKRAVHEFRVYLNWRYRLRLDKAWKEYHGGDEEAPDLLQYCNRDDGSLILRERLAKLRSIGKKNSATFWYLT